MTPEEKPRSGKLNDLFVIFNFSNYTIRFTMQVFGKRQPS
tara:strand:- start:185 stop:304 length:120 start_codon:yes stop_codon:yes gene_type:complete